MKCSETRAAIRHLKKLCQQDDMYGTQLEQLTDFQNVLTSHRFLSKLAYYKTTHAIYSKLKLAQR